MPKLQRVENGVYKDAQGNVYYSVWAYKKMFNVVHAQANYQISQALAKVVVPHKVPTELDTSSPMVCVYPQIALAGYFAKYG